MTNTAELAARLEELEAQDAHPSDILEVLRSVAEPGQLWEIADRVPAYLPIARMIFRRCLELGGPLETARGYLALAHIFDGDEETAMAIVSDAGDSGDPVLLSAWTQLAETPSEWMRRLRQALQRCPGDTRLTGQMEDLVRRYGDEIR